MNEDLEKLTREDLQRLLERIYENHQKDFEFYQAFKHGNEHDNVLLSGIFKTRVDRIDNDVAIALRQKAI